GRPGRGRAAAAAARGAGPAARPGDELRGDGPAAGGAGEHPEVALRRGPTPPASPAERTRLGRGGDLAVTCDDVRDRLPAHLYSDLSSAETVAVQAHLTACADCRHEFTALTGVRAALDAGPTPAVAVDLPRLYRAAADRQRLHLRRWRRVALAGTALAAALLLLLLGMKLDVRAGGQQVVVR